MESLEALLDTYHIDALRQIAETLALSPGQKPLRKAELVKQLGAVIPRLAKDQDFVRRLSDAEHAVLSRLLQEQRSYSKADVLLDLLPTGMFRIDGLPAAKGMVDLDDVLSGLALKGLLINLTDPPDGATRRSLQPVVRFAVPSEVSAVLPRDSLRPGAKGKLLEFPEPVVVRKSDLSALMRQLFFAWAELRDRPAARLKSGVIAKRDLRRLAQSLGLGEDDEALVLVTKWCDLLRALGLLAEDQNTLGAMEGDAVRLFWSGGPQAHLRALLTAYSKLETELPISLQHVPRISPYYGSAPLRSPAAIRKQVLEQVRRFEAFGWASVILLLDLMRRERVGDLILEDDTLNALSNSIRWYGRQSIVEYEQAIEDLELKAVVAILDELHTIGLVELGYSDAKDWLPTVFRLTAAAKALFSGQSDAPEANNGQIILQPDFQVLAMGPVSLSILAGLEGIAQRETYDRTVVSYRITRDSVYQALRRGETSGSIAAFLTEISDQALAQNIERTLEEWQAQYERVVIRHQVMFLQVDREGQMDAWMDDAVLGGMLHRIGSHVAWVRQADAEGVRQRLLELEILPAVSKGPTADVPNSLRWEGDVLRPRHPLPSLYVSGTVERIAEAVEGGWVLSPASVRSALASGMRAPEIIALIEQMTGQPVPLEWHKRIKAWCGHYGGASYGEEILLHFESDDALADLRRVDARLMRWLKPVAAGSGIAIVRLKTLESVLEALAEWGVEASPH